MIRKPTEREVVEHFLANGRSVDEHIAKGCAKVKLPALYGNGRMVEFHVTRQQMIALRISDALEIEDYETAARLKAMK